MIISIKSLIVWKGIIIEAVFHTLMYEQGYFQVDKVKFDQVNNAGIRGGEHLEKQHIMNEERVIWWRKP